MSVELPGLSSPLSQKERDWRKDIEERLKFLEKMEEGQKEIRDKWFIEMVDSLKKVEEGARKGREEIGKRMGDAMWRVPEKHTLITPNDGGIHHIASSEVSVRLWNILDREDIRTIEDLSEKTENNLLEFRGLGESMLGEVRELLGKYGLKFRREDA